MRVLQSLSEEFKNARRADPATRATLALNHIVNSTRNASMGHQLMKSARLGVIKDMKDFLPQQAQDLPGRIRHLEPYYEGTEMSGEFLLLILTLI